MKYRKDLSPAQQLEVLEKACDSFAYFTEEIFSLSSDVFKDGKWTGGVYVDELASWLQANPKTIRVSAKDHMKSMLFYSHIMWKILRVQVYKRSREINYFSYMGKMAAYHVAKIKDAVKCNEWYEGIIDHKKLAKGMIDYRWEDKYKVTVTPRGLLEFKRGIHCQDIYVDDPFQDPENKMMLTKIKKVNDVMKSQILDMVQDELHIAGTPQTKADFFFDEKFCTRFSKRVLPAIVDKKNKIALWPEWMNFDELEAKRLERGDKLFNQEYLCSPVYSENAYFNAERLMTKVDPTLKNYSAAEWEKEIERREQNDEETDTDRVGGWDLGKKSHPAHFTWFEKTHDGKRIQRHSKWFDGVDYTSQLEYIVDVIERCGLYVVYFDNTRGELEMMIESGELPAELEPVHFTFKGKNAMAAGWDKAMTKDKVRLLNDERMLNQILIVNEDLQAPATPEGHGDSFWSIGLTFRDVETEMDITII